MFDDIQNMIERVKAGSCDEADLQAIATAIASGKIVLANAPRSVGIGGDALSSQIVTGDGNIIINGVDAQIGGGYQECHKIKGVRLL